MNLNTQYLLQNVVNGTASGNYDGSSLDFYSDAVTAADYYQGYGSVQTIAYRVENFVGTITIEATLNDDRNAASWFEINRYDQETPITDYHPVTVIGNFVWLRARVQNFDAGTIQFVTVTY